MKPKHVKLLKIIEDDRQDLADLCLMLGNTPSLHAEERVVADKIVDWLNNNSIEGWLQPITDKSANAVGMLPGKEDGTSLIFNAHIDTELELPPNAPERLRRISQAWVDGDMIYGAGVINDKGQLAAFMIATRALLKAGIGLKGDLTVAGVAHETGRPSFGESQGIDCPGSGFGTWWLVNRGIVADYALVGETSGFGLVTVECGKLGIEVRTRGKKIYTPRYDRGPSLQEHPSSIVRMAHLVPAIEEWAVGYEQNEARTFEGGTIRPKVQITSIQGKATNTSVLLDVFLIPGANPGAIMRGLKMRLKGSGLDCDVKAYQWSRGYFAQRADRLIDAVTVAHQSVFDAPPAKPPTPELSMWRDINIFNEVGIPSICYGPPRQKESLSDLGDRGMKISDLLAATKVYALTAIAIL